MRKSSLYKEGHHAKFLKKKKTAYKFKALMCFSPLLLEELYTTCLKTQQKKEK